MTDQEAVYQLIIEARWPAVLDVLYQERSRLADDPLLAQAMTTFVASFFAALDVSQKSPAPPEVEVLERLFLLHTGGFYALPDARFTALVVRLVEAHAERPEAALGYARHCPAHPVCAAVLRRTAQPSPLPADGTIHHSATTPDAGPRHTRSLFRSQQEETFYLAVREVYATYLVYPNVALRAVVDLETLGEALPAAARRYAFTALLDCVVIDQHDGYRPLVAFELDSPWHDTPERQANDHLKEMVLSQAGLPLHRLRPQADAPDRHAFLTLLREL